MGGISFLAKVDRFSFSTPPKLMKQFDDSLRAIGYKDRSKGLQVAMRNFVTEYNFRGEKNKLGAGAVLLTYDHRSHGVQEALTDIQHHYRDTINSTTHIHLDEFRCLEIISVKGRLETIQGMAKDLMKTKGVSQLKLSTVSL
jgi:CopG family nickel-responsive transcriptional regulator